MAACTKSMKNNDWIDRLVPCVQAPFNIVVQFGGRANLFCKPLVSRTVVRRAMYHSWTNSCPPFEGKHKKWGFLRETCVTFVMDQHPEIFSSQAMHDLKIEGRGGQAGKDVFLKIFQESDKAGQKTASSSDEDKDEQAEQTASAASKILLTSMLSRPSRADARQFRRFYLDESVMLALTTYANKCKLHVDWGIQMGDAANVILEKVSEHPPDPTASWSYQILSIAASIWEVFDAQLDNSWFDFADLAQKLVYNNSQATDPQHVLDTCDAIFGSGPGCQRFRLLKHNVTTFIFERLLPAPAILLSYLMQQKAKPEIADRITEAVNNMTKDDWCSFWASAMFAKTELEFECSMNTFMPVVREKPCQAMELATPIKPEPKDPDTTSVAQSSPLVVPKFISDSIQQTIPGTEGSPALYSFVSSFLTSELKQFFLPDRKHLFADFGWKNIYEHSGVLYCDEMRRNLKLTYIGDVSIFPSEGSIRIGVLLGATLFVTSPAKLVEAHEGNNEGESGTNNRGGHQLRR